MATPTTSIDALPAKTGPTGAELLIVQDTGITKKMPISELGSLTSAALTAHLADDTDAHDASAISATTSGTGIDGPNVQVQLGQLASKVNTLEGGDVMWVGTDTPPDPTVEVWWDTNETSGSVMGLASDAETIAGVVVDKAVTPAGLEAASTDIDPRKYGFDPAATGVVNSAALQAAIDEACGPGNPATVARYATRRVVLPAGVYLLNTPVKIYSVIGFEMVGHGRCELRANANMTSVLDINGIAMCRIGGFTITGSAGVQVDNVVYTYWDNTTAAFNNSGNSYHDIGIRNIDFITAFRAGKPGSTIAVDNIEYRNIDINGAWTTGNTTRYQNGLLLGSGVGANNLVHHVYKFRGWNVRYPLKIESTQCAVYGAGIAGCDTAIYAQPWGYALFDSFDVESAERLFFTPGTTFNANVSISNITFRANKLVANGRWIDFNMAGTLNLSQLMCLGAAVTPVAITAGTRTRVNVNGLAVSATTNPSANLCFLPGANTVVRCTGFVRLDASGVPTLIEDYLSDGGGSANYSALTLGDHVRAEDSVLVLDAPNGNVNKVQFNRAGVQKWWVYDANSAGFYVRDMTNNVMALSFWPGPGVTGQIDVGGQLKILGDLVHQGAKAGFYNATPVAKQTAVPVTIAAVHAALVNLGLIT